MSIICINTTKISHCHGKHFNAPHYHHRNVNHGHWEMLAYKKFCIFRPGLFVCSYESLIPLSGSNSQIVEPDCELMWPGWTRPGHGVLADSQYPWWRHQMETFSALLAICAGNSPVTGEFPTQRPVTRSFDVYFDLRPNERLSKQWWGWWLETLSRSLWRHRNADELRAVQMISYPWWFIDIVTLLAIIWKGDLSPISGIQTLSKIKTYAIKHSYLSTW